MKSNTIFVDNHIAIDCLDYCSLSFLSLALLEDEKQNILFFTSQNYLLVKSELNHLKINTKIYKNYQDRVDFVFLKTTMHHMDDTFFQLFEEKVQNFSGDLIYFDRIDYFLEFTKSAEYKKALEKIKVIVNQYQKKIIYIYSSKSTHHSYINTAIKKNTTKLDFMNRNKKEIKMSTLHALQDELLDDKKQQSHASFVHDEESKIQVMLMSDNDELKKLQYYIFSSSEGVDYYTIDLLPDDEMSIVEEMDIIIYNKEDQTLKKGILEYIRKNKLAAKFFEITDNDYLRQKDLLLANIAGVDKLFKKNFLMEDFVMSIEMYLNSNFYSKRLINLDVDNEIVLNKKESFDDKINLLLSKKVFFSVLTYHYEADADIGTYNIQKIVREYDNIYINARHKQMHFLILNTIPDFAKELIEERIQNFSIILEEKERKSAFDLVFDN